MHCISVFAACFCIWLCCQKLQCISVFVCVVLIASATLAQQIVRGEGPADCQPMTDVGSEWETCLKTAIVFAVPFGETSSLEIINCSFKGKHAAFIFTRR